MTDKQPEQLQYSLLALLWLTLVISVTLGVGKFVGKTLGLKTGILAGYQVVISLYLVFASRTWFTSRDSQRKFFAILVAWLVAPWLIGYGYWFLILEVK